MSYAFDFVEVDVPEQTGETVGGDEQEPEEFAFQLFSGVSAVSALPTVSLKEDETEAATVVRPESYYFHRPCSQLKEQYEQAAVNFDYVYAELHAPVVDGYPRKVVTLQELNRDHCGHKRKRLGSKQRKLKSERKEALKKAQKLEKLRMRRARERPYKRGWHRSK